MKLSDDLKYWRAERPDEWSMDAFIRKAIEYEAEIEHYKKIVYQLKKLVKFVEDLKK